MKIKKRNSEFNYEKILEKLKIGVYRASVDLNGKFIDVNNAMVEIFGYGDRDELLNIKVKDLYGEKINRKEFINKLKKYGFVRHKELRLKRKDGTPIWCTDTATAIYDKKGEIKYIEGIIEDITSLKAIKERLSLINEIVQNMQEMVLVANKEGKIIFTNPAIENILGYKPEEILGDNWWVLVHPDEKERKREKDYISGVARGEIKVRNEIYESSLKHKNGEIRWVAWRDSWLPSGYIIGVGRDITEEKRTREKLKLSEKRYKTLFEYAGNVLFMINSKGLVLAVNKKGEELLSLPKEKIENKINVFKFLPSKERKRIILNIERRLRGEDIPSEYEIDYSIKKGEIRNARISVQLVPETNNFIVSLIDITEEKKLLHQLIQQEKVSAVGQMLSGITHQLNNPLSTVMGYIELLMNSNIKSSEEIREKLDTIYENTLRIDKIIKNLLSFISSKPFERIYMNLNDLIKRILEIKKYEFNLDSIDIIEELEPELPRTMADSSQIQQVLLQILNNAQTALKLKKGKREIKIKTYSHEKSIFLSIKDNGPGIKREILDQIFNPFFTNFEGKNNIGMGLAVSLKIIQEHGGKISAKSEPGKGAEFLIELPIVKMEEIIKESYSNQ